MICRFYRLCIRLYWVTAFSHFREFYFDIDFKSSILYSVQLLITTTYQVPENGCVPLESPGIF